MHTLFCAQGVSLFLSKLHKSFIVGKRAEVYALFTRCYILQSEFISQLDLQENGSYTVFVCLLVLCFLCQNCIESSSGKNGYCTK